MITVAELQAKMGWEDAAFRQGVASANATINRLGSDLQRAGARLSVGLTAPLAAGFGQAVKVFGDFEQNLNVFRQAAGATAAQMADVSRLAEKLGADLTLPNTSAADAAAAMTELAKAGLSVKDSMGAARGALQLGAAAGVSAAQAAQITANALNAFGLAGDQAAHVSDLLAGAANNASGEITDMAQGFKQASAAFKTAGFTVDDLATSMAILAKAGVLGSDAGTSLRVMAGRLVPQTKQAAAAMKALGVSTVDASGNIRPLREQIAQFSRALANLPSGQKVNVLKAIFGEDAQRAAGILFSNAKAFDAMGAAVGRQGNAAAAAAAKNKGLKGALDAIKSAFEGAAIAGIKTVADDLRQLALQAAAAINRFAELDPHVRRGILLFGGLAAAVGPVTSLLGGLVGGIGRVLPVVRGLVTGLGTLAAALGTTGSLIGITVVALGTLAYAFATNMNGVRDAAVSGWAQVTQAFTSGIEVIRQGFGDFWADLLNNAANFWSNLRNLSWEQVKGWGDDFRRGWEIVKANQQRGWEEVKRITGLGAQKAGESLGVTKPKNYVLLPKGSNLGLSPERFKQIVEEDKKYIASLERKSQPPSVPRFRPQTVRNPAIDALMRQQMEGRGRKARAQKSPLQQQQEQYAAAMADASVELSGRQKGYTRELIDTAKQYDLLGPKEQQALARRLAMIRQFDENKQAAEQFRAEQQRLDLELKRAMGIDTTLLDLRRQFPKASAAQIQKMAETIAATKKQTAAHQAAQEAEQKRKDAIRQMVDELHDAQIEADAWGQKNEVIRRAMLRFKVGADELTQSQKDWAAAMIGFEDTAETGKKIFEEDKAAMDAFVEANHKAIQDFRNMQKGFGELTSGSRERVKAWQEYGQVFEDLDLSAQDAIKRLIEYQDNLDFFQSFADGVRGVFDDLFRDLFDHGFKGFFSNVIGGFTKMIQQMAAQYLASKLTDLILNTVAPAFGSLFFGGGKAGGGGVSRGVGYLVGEHGPELFMPNTSGRIVPNSQLAGAGGMTIQMTINTPDARSFRENEGAIQAQAYRMAERMRRRNGG